MLTTVFLPAIATITGIVIYIKWLWHMTKRLAQRSFSISKPMINGPLKKANRYFHVSQSIFFKNSFYQQKIYLNYGYKMFCFSLIHCKILMREYVSIYHTTFPWYHIHGKEPYEMTSNLFAIIPVLVALYCRRWGKDSWIDTIFGNPQHA